MSHLLDANALIAPARPPWKRVCSHAIPQLALMAQREQQHFPFGVSIEHDVPGQHKLAQFRHAKRSRELQCLLGLEPFPAGLRLEESGRATTGRGDHAFEAEHANLVLADDIRSCGRGLALRPVFQLESRNTLELAQVVRHQREAKRDRMRCDLHVQWADRRPLSL